MLNYLKIAIVLFFGCIVFTAFAEPKSKLMVHTDNYRGVVTLENYYDQAIFCVRHEKAKLIKFYIKKGEKSIPFPVYQKFWCALPKEKIV